MNTMLCILCSDHGFSIAASQFLRSSTCTLPRARLCTLKQPTPTSTHSSTSVSPQEHVSKAIKYSPNFHTAPHRYLHKSTYQRPSSIPPASTQLHIGISTRARIKCRQVFPQLPHSSTSVSPQAHDRNDQVLISTYRQRGTCVYCRA